MAKKELLYFPFLGMFSKYSFCFVCVLLYIEIRLCAKGPYFDDFYIVRSKPNKNDKRQTVDHKHGQFLASKSISSALHKDKGHLATPRGDGGTTRIEAHMDQSSLAVSRRSWMFCGCYGQEQD